MSLLPTHETPHRRSLLLVLALTLLVAFCAGRTPRTTADDPARVDLAQLWVEPRDLESRDFYHGPGGAALAPNPSVPFEFIAVDNTGYSPGYDVRDPKGIEWSVKLGIEAQPEVVASRVLWAIGFYQPPTYLLSKWELGGKQTGMQGAARFRRELADREVLSDWSWYENPFVATQPFKGLVVANLILNNWDLKTSNNKIYQVSGDGSAPRRLYIVRDLGASLGKTTFPPFLAWTPFRLMKQGSRNDLEDFEAQGFVRRGADQRIEFDYRGIHTSLVETLTIDDVLWTCKLMARISDRQWDDTFRAAGYEAAQRRRFISKLKSKIGEGLALGRS